VDPFFGQEQHQNNQHQQQDTGQAHENECVLCLEQITGTQQHMGEVTYCASQFHMFHSACVTAYVTKDECPLKCGPMWPVQQQPAHHNAQVQAPVQVQQPAAVHQGVNIVPTGSTDLTQAVVLGATVTAQGYDYQVHGGALNTAAQDTEYDILLADNSLLVQGVAVQADDGAGTYTFSVVWEDVEL